MQLKMYLILLPAFLFLSCTASQPKSDLGPSGATSGPPGQTYYVDGDNASAADTNPGTREKPWKTVARAGAAKELKPGDTVLIRAGCYRESAKITVSGEPGRPITFAAAPGARVVLKGSELIKGAWTKLSQDKSVKEPFPNAFQNIWKVQLGEEYFLEQPDKGKRHISQVFVSDRTPLQMIGPSPMYDNAQFTILEPIGRGLADMQDMSFYFDPREQTLYVKIGGEPGWYWIEVGVRNQVLGIEKAHDIIVRGLELRHNLDYNVMGLSECRRVLVEDCKLNLAAFSGLAVGLSDRCVIRRCDLSWNGNSGLNLHRTTDCTVEDCSVMFNNYRRFSTGWHAGGMKNIPNNRRSTIQRCEVAYNLGCGIWFDVYNTDIRLLDNICHHNTGCGIFHEGNFGGGVFAGNLCYANGGSGIGVADHVPQEMVKRIAKGEFGKDWQEPLLMDMKDWIDIPDKPLYIVHNTLAANMNGIWTEDRGKWQILRNVIAMNNLLLHNTQPGDKTAGATADLLFWMHGGADDKRTVTSNHSDYNVLAEPAIFKPAYGFFNTRTLAQWRERFGEDRHSQVLPIDFDCGQNGFMLRTTQGLDIACPLPEGVKAVWKADHPRRVGANLTQWLSGPGSPAKQTGDPRVILRETRQFEGDSRAK